MDLIAVACGAGLVLAVALDVFRTVLLPAAGGGISTRLARALWWAVVRSPAPLRRRLLAAVGPCALVLAVVVWMGSLLVGFALCYVPFVDGFAFAPTPRFADAGWAEALYVSGTTLTTVGFGDVVAQSTPLRLLMVAEAACGLAVLTAALGYLPAIYTVVSALRAADQAVVDLGADTAEGAAELLAVNASTTVDGLRRDVIAARQHLLRFPVLHWFAPPYDESVVALGRGAVSVWVAGHFARDGGEPVHRHVRALEQALRRLADELSAHGTSRRVPVDPASAETEFDRARRLSRCPAAGPAVPDTSVALLARVRQVLDGYAAGHAFPGDHETGQGGAQP